MGAQAGGNGGFGGGGGAGAGAGGFIGGNASGASGGGGTGLGGAIFNMFGSVTLVNSTLYGNSAQGGAGGDASAQGGGAFGGGIFNLDGTVSLTNCTLANNTVTAGANANAGYGGGAVFSLAFGNKLSGGAQTATVTSANSIFAGSGVSNDLEMDDVNGKSTNTSTMNNSGPNISQTAPFAANGATITGITITVTDPKLDPAGPKSNGGPTETIALISAKRLTQTCTTVMNKNLITVQDSSQLAVGMNVTGTGIPAGNIITNIVGTQITLSANATQSGSFSLTFSNLGSPAIAAANPSQAPATDQRGISRGPTPDLGAFQTPFTDTFHRANSTNLGSNWTTVLPNDGHLRQPGGRPDHAGPVLCRRSRPGQGNLSLTNAADSALVNVGISGERYAGVFARRNTAGDMYVAMLGVNTTGTPHNPAATPTAALLFRFTPELRAVPSAAAGVSWSTSSCPRHPTPAARTWDSM